MAPRTVQPLSMTPMFRCCFMEMVFKKGVRLKGQKFRISHQQYARC